MGVRVPPRAQEITITITIAITLTLTLTLTLVILIVLVIVIAPVDALVAALGNGNDHVPLIEAVDASWIDQLRQHRHDPLEQLDTARVLFLLDQLLAAHDIQMRSGLHRRAPRNRVVLRLVGPRRSTAALGDVLRDRLRRTSKLIGQVCMALGDTSSNSLR
jgi:hypothetical protein